MTAAAGAIVANAVRMVSACVPASFGVPKAQMCRYPAPPSVCSDLLEALPKLPAKICAFMADY